MKVTVRQSPLTRGVTVKALLKIFSENGQWLLTIHEGRLVGYAKVPPKTVLKEDAKSKQGS